jgi:hypothetical protein
MGPASIRSLPAATSVAVFREPYTRPGVCIFEERDSSGVGGSPRGDRRASALRVGLRWRRWPSGCSSWSWSRVRSELSSDSKRRPRGGGDTFGQLDGVESERASRRWSSRLSVELLQTSPSSDGAGRSGFPAPCRVERRGTTLHGVAQNMVCTLPRKWSPASDHIGSPSAATPMPRIVGVSTSATRIASRIRGCCGSERAPRSLSRRRHPSIGTSVSRGELRASEGRG